jgi:endonuclease/exonuclease/phosphatase family metal-dependent hydrolase
MHRVRYYKINERIVWDRTNKIDVLTGSEQQNQVPDGMSQNKLSFMNSTLFSFIIDIGQSANFVQGLYHFDHSLQQWRQYSHISLSADDPRTPSSNDTCLPEQCHFLTWNILFDYYHSSLIHTSQRYPAILDTLKSLLPDVICLQEVTASFLNLLLNEVWLQEHHYYIIITQSVANSDKDKSYGQLMLTKNFRPRSFSICPLDVSDDSTTTSTTTTKKATKELMIARFGLTSRITIDLVNLHLHSDLSHNSDEKRCRALENLFKHMNTSNYMLIGDFNFGDYNEKEQNMLEKYSNDVHDLWREIYDLNEVRYSHFIDFFKFDFRILALLLIHQAISVLILHLFHKSNVV